MRESVQKLKNKFNKFRTEKGFTLVELMAVLAILALIVMIAVPAIGNILEKAKVQSAEANIELIENAAELAYISDDATFPAQDTYTAQELSTNGFLKADAETITDFDLEYDLAKTGNSGTFEATVKPVAP